MAESIVFQNNNSLAVHWLRLCALFVGSEVSIPVWGIKIPHATQTGLKIFLKIFKEILQKNHLKMKNCIPRVDFIWSAKH